MEDEMANSSDIRKDNKKKIYRLMLDHQQYTKQQISVKTGLSVATCNTLLNDMTANKVLVTGEEKEFRGVGRSSWLYEIDGEHEHYILVSFAVNQGMRNVDYYVVSATGNIIRKECTVCETIDCENVISVIDGLISDCSSMKQIVLGIPGVIDGAEIEFCDIKELEIADIKRKLQEHFKLMLCKRKGVKIIEAEICPDHVHMLVEIPPSISVSYFVGYLKGKSTLMIFERHANLKYKYGNRHFWCRQCLLFLIS